MKKFLLIMPIALLTGCAITEWIVQNGDSINEAGETVEGFGPYGFIVTLLTTTVVAGAKWYQGTRTVKGLVETVEKVKKELPPESKALLKKAFITHMPVRIKGIVSKVKKKL